MTRVAFAVAAALLSLIGAAAPLGAEAQTTPDFARIDRYIEDQRQAEHIPGIALGIVRDGQVSHLRGYGTADDSGRVVTPQTPFLIGSLSKSMTALAILQLVEAGKLELDAPVQRYLPWFTVADRDASARITLRHLLHQTSGFPPNADNDAIARAETGPGALEHEVRALRDVQLAGSPGERHRYSNANYMVLGLLVQAASGEPYASYLENHILRPIGMTHSFTSKDAAREYGLASGHRYWFGFPVASELPYPEGGLAAGYVISTAEDMARYLTMIQNGGRVGNRALVLPTRMAELLQPGAEAGGPNVFYAMGWTVAQDGDVRVVGHAGGTFNFRAAMGVMPDRGLGYVLLMNADTALGRGRLTAIPDGVYSLLLDRELPQPESSTPVLVIYGVLLVILAIQIGGMLRTVLTKGHWRTAQSVRPRGRARLVRHIVVPGLSNLAWAAIALVGLPAVLGGSLAMLQLQIPDIAYVLTVSGGVALVWTVLRSLVVSAALRPKPEPARPMLSTSRA